MNNFIKGNEVINIKLNEHLDCTLKQLKENFCVDEQCSIIFIEGKTRYPCEFCDCPVSKFIKYIINEDVW